MYIKGHQAFILKYIFFNNKKYENEDSEEEIINFGWEGGLDGAYNEEIDDY